MTAQATPAQVRATAKRRTRFYFEIHFGKRVVSGTALYSGMLEAERQVDARRTELAKKIHEPFRGYWIIRNRMRKDFKL